MTWVRETEGTPPKPQGWLKPREGSESPLSLLFLPQLEQHRFAEQSLEESIPLEQLPAALSPALLFRSGKSPGKGGHRVSLAPHH